MTNRRFIKTEEGIEVIKESSRGPKSLSPTTSEVMRTGGSARVAVLDLFAMPGDPCFEIRRERFMELTRNATRAHQVTVAEGVGPIVSEAVRPVEIPAEL